MTTTTTTAAAFDDSSTRPPEPRWAEGSGERITHGVALVFVRAVLLFIVGMGIIGGTLVGDDIFKGGWTSIALVAGLLGVLDVGLVLAVGLLRTGRVSLKELGWKLDAVTKDVGLGLAGFAACAAVLVGAMISSGEYTVASIAQTILHYSASERFIFLCISVFGASLVEETLFRGYLQPALATKVGLAAAIVVQAVLFSVMHMNFNPISLLVKFFFGVVFGVLRGRDRSLLAPAVAHGLIWAIIGAP